MQVNGYIDDDGIEAVTATLKSGLDAGEKEPHPDLPDQDETPRRQERRSTQGARWPKCTSFFTSGSARSTTPT